MASRQASRLGPGSPSLKSTPSPSLSMIFITVFFLARARGCRGRMGRPGHVQIPQRLGLLQNDVTLPVELEHGEKPGDHLIDAGAVRAQLPERGPVYPAQPFGEDRDLLRDAG